MGNHDDAFEVRKREIANKRKAAKKRRKKAFLKKLCIFFLIVAIIVMVILSLTIFFPVKSIVVRGDSPYSAEEIIKASGIEKNKNLWLTGLDAEENIPVALPFVSSAKISRKLPGNIIIEVKESVPKYSYKLKNTFLICDEFGKVLKKDRSPMENTMVISGSTAKTTKVGNNIAFENQEFSELVKLIDNTLKKHNLNVDLIDVTTKVKILIRVEGRFNVQIGSTAYLDLKINHLAGMIEKVAKDRKGSIDLSDYSPENPNGILKRE